MSKLEQFGLTKDAILAGEVAEFEAVKPKLVNDKREFLDKEVVDRVVEAYAADLHSSLLREEELDEELEYRAERIAELEKQVEKLSGDIRKADGFGAQMSHVESMMDALENSVNDFNIQHQKDVQTIRALQSKQAEDSRLIGQLQEQLQSSIDDVTRMNGRLQELEDDKSERDVEFESLREDVNAVLDTLREQLASHGIYLDEEE